jgi:hypothetical protein
MFSLAFLECFTLVLAIGHLISPLVFIEVKVIQFLVFSVVQNCRMTDNFSASFGKSGHAGILKRTYLCQVSDIGSPEPLVS